MNKGFTEEGYRNSIIQEDSVKNGKVSLPCVFCE